MSGTTMTKLTATLRELAAPGSRWLEAKKMPRHLHEGGGNSILIVTAKPVANFVLEQCVQRGWSVVAARLCSEAEVALRANAPGIVITQDTLPDGTWREVFQSAAAIDPDAVRVVCSGRSTLRLWMDVFSQGGSELLPEPCPEALLERVFNRYGKTRARTPTAA
jgi:DNA-binding NtrC family response regulator